MRPLSRTQALDKLSAIRENFRSLIKEDYEFRAKDCGTCETKGACCLDAHFVKLRRSIGPPWGQDHRIALAAAIAAMHAGSVLD